ncbi:E3 ubiquitin-protein ligase XIAP [Haplochromis burtoni]|uniref:E3 ubiquitin-protein ligase XIAP n=1 Tax=Haplochromis burtoni TaxID=8153 RepID=A0A3Q2WBK9_HAPBU|nr:E3 ubiquitin-protein ligase XIAP [Haplochromis burtoni]
MCDLSQDGVWESDNAPDFSSLTRRIDSFRGSNLANKVPAETLAQAGFFYTGESDRVRCFSCNMTVDNWYSGDRPVDKHKQFSPSCTFLTCVHRTSFNQNSNTALISEEVGDVEYRLRTGEVVDEAPYPIVPHMRNEEARLRTFSSWPNRTPVRPRDLAQAGFFYVGQSDKVQCFCCGGRLNGWEPGDSAWSEHSKHYPNCYFILGHDVGNIPIQTGIEEDASNNRRAIDPALMQNFEARRATFAGVRHPIDHERLARAGFYSTGRGDAVLCFHCSGGLNNWQPEEDPWVEHAKHYPGCSFLLANKGPEFVNSIQLQRPQHDRAASSHQNPVSEDMEDEDPLEKLQRLQREKQCKICMDRDIAIVFIPCAHLVACENCSQALNKCPICCQDITQKIKTYIA